VAEGVEDEAQHEFLMRHGCEAVQGHLLGRPVPPAEFEARWLRG
jgi:EAL domain-containing protein (putative c-di-GMP-specific phosphodiesterase class I)